MFRVNRLVWWYDRFIGLPYFAPAGVSNPHFQLTGPELSCYDVDQFRLEKYDAMNPATEADLLRLFEKPEQQVKEAFGQILGLSVVPADWGGEHSDLVAGVSINGVWARAAFAFKGPGGKPKPWTLHPGKMGEAGRPGRPTIRRAGGHHGYPTLFLYRGVGRPYHGCSRYDAP
jgi:hypothetical protein